VEKLAEGVTIVGGEKNNELVLCKALSEYRAGRFAGAVDWIRRYSPQVTTRPLDAVAFDVLAMSQARLGDREEAQSALANAQKILAAKPKGQFLVNWLDWLHAEILCHEAQKVLSDSSSNASRP
jgi:Flp pilus assembly protein TadD